MKSTYSTIEEFNQLVFAIQNDRTSVSVRRELVKKEEEGAATNREETRGEKEKRILFSLTHDKRSNKPHKQLHDSNKSNKHTVVA